MRRYSVSLTPFRIFELLEHGDVHFHSYSAAYYHIHNRCFCPFDYVIARCGDEYYVFPKEVI